MKTEGGKTAGIVTKGYGIHRRANSKSNKVNEAIQGLFFNPHHKKNTQVNLSEIRPTPERPALWLESVRANHKTERHIRQVIPEAKTKM